ncbi:carbohydrate ABC transporter permease [Streptomyces sp. NPDC047853]|uniref:carbohydrate ABC transporter permease n=1 Tax=unclassified Streptomyces TaxID=2593676 RepID=UPI00345147D6
MRTPRRQRTTAPRGRTLSQRDARTGLALITPTLVVVVLVVLIPLAWTLSLAFQPITLLNISYAGFFGTFTLDNFRAVLTSPGFYSALWTTLLYTFGSTAGSIVVGMVAALVVRRKFRGRSLVRALMLLPYVAPVVAVTFVWSVMLNPQFGIVNEWGTRYLGWDTPVAFLSQPSTALLTVIAFEIWRYYPFAFLFMMARLQAVPDSIEEAARVDGATPLQVFWHIILPQLLPTMGVLFALRFVFTFNKFDDVFLLTGGGAGTEVVSVRVFDFLTAHKDVGAASAQAAVLALVLAGYLVFQWWIGRRKGGSEL